VHHCRDLNLGRCGSAGRLSTVGRRGQCPCSGARFGGLEPDVELDPQGLSVLAEAAVGEPWTGAADVAPGAHPQVEVAPRFVRPAPGQVAIRAGWLHHPDAAGLGLDGHPLRMTGLTRGALATSCADTASAVARSSWPLAASTRMPLAVSRAPAAVARPRQVRGRVRGGRPVSAP